MTQRAFVYEGTAGRVRPMANGCCIAPMAGEIDVVEPDEIVDFGRALTLRGIRHAHFYAASTDVNLAILAAIRSL